MTPWDLITKLRFSGAFVGATRVTNIPGNKIRRNLQLRTQNRNFRLTIQALRHTYKHYKAGIQIWKNSKKSLNCFVKWFDDKHIDLYFMLSFTKFCNCLNEQSETNGNSKLKLKISFPKWYLSGFTKTFAVWTISSVL